MRDTLYDRYGLLKVTQIVSHFYRAVLASPTLARYFRGVNIPALADHQAAFMSAVMGGQSAQNELQLREAHARLEIRSEDFDEMIEILRQSLESHNVLPDDVEAVCHHYEGFKGVIVGE